MSDVYDTYIDKDGYERWSSNDKMVYVKNKRGNWQISVLPKWARKKKPKKESEMMNKNKCWTEDDTMQCINYLKEERTKREVNIESQYIADCFSALYDGMIFNDESHTIDYSITRKNDGSFTYEYVFSGINEYCEPEEKPTPSTRLNIPLPFFNKILQVVFTLANKD